MADIVAPASLTAAVAEIWTGLSLDDQAVQAPGAQARYRAVLERDLGSDWVCLVDEIRGRLAKPPHSTIIRGRSAGEAHALLAAVATSVGEMANPYRELVPGSPVLQEITPKGPDSPDLVWLWHTDSANWPVPNDYSALACLRAAPSGGATQTLSLHSMRDSPKWSDDVLAPLWEREFVWPVDSWLGGGSFTDRSIGPRGLRFRRELMAGRGSPSYQAAVDSFATLADHTEPDVVALLRPGDVLIFDNAKAMHRAGPVDDPQRQRLLLRTKIKKC